METFNVLWTGGWDSTYRVLDLVLSKGISVTPHYLIDATRKSTRNELEAIETIKALANERAAGGARIGPTQIVSVGDLPTEPFKQDFEAHLKGIMGYQYYFIAAYRASRDVPGLEISINQGTPIRDAMEKRVNSGGIYYQLREPCTDPGKNLFRGLHLPLLGIRKFETIALSKEAGFFDLMCHSWFCHAPINDQPCGQCTPCALSVKDGFWFRFTPAGKARYLANKVKWKLRSLLKLPK